MGEERSSSERAKFSSIIRPLNQTEEEEDPKIAHCLSVCLLVFQFALSSSRGCQIKRRSHNRCSGTCLHVRGLSDPGDSKWPLCVEKESISHRQGQGLIWQPWWPPRDRLRLHLPPGQDDENAQFVNYTLSLSLPPALAHSLLGILFLLLIGVAAFPRATFHLLLSSHTRLLFARRDNECTLNIAFLPPSLFSLLQMDPPPD